MSDELLQLIDILPCSYVCTDHDNRIISFSKSLLNLLALPENGVRGRRLTSFFTENSKYEFETRILPILHKEKRIQDVSVDLVRSDSCWVPVLMRATLVCTNDGSSSSVHFIVSELPETVLIDTRAALPAALLNQNLAVELDRLKHQNLNLIKIINHKKETHRKQTALYQQISEGGRIGGWELDLRTGNLYWSTVTKQIHEVDDTFKPDLTTAINFYKKGESRDALQEAIDVAIQTGAAVDVELQMITAKGREIWVQVKGYTEWSANEALRIFGTLQDIDQRKKLMLQLQQVNNKIEQDNAYYKSIIENQSFYIVKTDLRGKYTYMNPFFCHMLGIRAEDWLGKNSLGLIVPEDRSLCVDTVRKCFADPAQSQWVILRKPSPKGIIHNQWEFKLVTDVQGNFTEFLCLGHEITSLIKKQEELQTLVDITTEQNERLRNFAYILSHNIRSHVANLGGIINSYDPDDEADKDLALELMRTSVNNLDTTVHDLNEIISIQSNRNLPITTLTIRHEVDRVIESIQQLILDSGASLHCHFDDQEKLSTNVPYFNSIVLNLLTNAIKYRSPQRALVIHIRTYTEGTYKVFTVQDNGLGIDLNRHRAKLFNMYKTFHGNSDANGLGLYITRTQIEALKGKIDVESGVNVGTTFKVYFNENH